MPPPNIPSNVLIVCMGNICRSPTAEAVLRSSIAEAGLAIQVDSAGTENYHIGRTPDPRSIAHARRRGYELGGLRARQVVPEDFLRFDLILAADEMNLSVLKRLCPIAYRHKLALFLGNQPLPDPYYGESNGFEQVLDLVEQRCSVLVGSWSDPQSSSQ
ncbi:MAG: low molecular weight protein-tyrosine-phosphatase [Verrucomicrobiota bacterium]